MSSIIKVDTIQDQSGNNIINENADTITIGASGDTITVPSGATLEVNTIEPQSGTTVTLGASGDTITVPSGANLNVPSGATLNVSGTLGSGIRMKPFFKVYKSANTTLSSGVATKVVHNGVVYDPDDVYDNSTGTFTVPSGEGGFYFFNVLTRLTGSSGDTFENANTQLNVNGSNVEYRQKSYSTGGGNFNNDQIQLNTIIELAATNTVEVYTTLFVSSGTPILVGSSSGAGTVTRFEGFKLIGL